MGLKLKLENLEGLDQSLHSMYVKDGEGWKLDVEGVEDVSGLKGALQAQKDANKVLKDNAKKYEGLGDPELIKQIMGRMANDEETRLIAEGKIDVVIEKRTERLKAELTSQVGEANKRAETAEGKAKKYSQRVLDDQIRAAASTAGVHAAAIDDALFRGRTMFSLDEEGHAVQLDEDGKAIPGKDGKSPFTPEEWLGGMKEKAPHWFPANANGGGANGSRGRTPGPDLSKLPPVERMNAARGVTN